MRSAAAVVCAVALAACTIGETRHETVVYPSRKSQAVKRCHGAFAKPDLDKLPPCYGGLGHCYDKTKMPSTQDHEPCDDATVCVPNEVLLAAGERLAPCTSSVGGQPGVCVGLALPRLAAARDAISADVCDAATQRCVPCINPENDEPNPYCTGTGVYETACGLGDGEAKEVQTCCHYAGVCMSESALEKKQREHLGRDTCSGSKLCVPGSQYDGAPTKCDVLGADGVCIDLCFAGMLQGARALLRSSCGPTEVCLPCAVGKGQGMLGCD